MLHDVTSDGGPGFCHTVLPSVLPGGYHGPLVIALDSNVLIDLQEHGNILLNGEEPGGVDPIYADELDALATILDRWMLHDIRFIVTPRSLTDAKRISQKFLENRHPAVEAIARSLAYQLADWTYVAPSYQSLRMIGMERGLPDGADRDLVLEAQAAGAHVFLTRDRLVLEKAALTGPKIAIVPPTWLADELTIAGVGPYGGSTCGENTCVYEGSLPAPDIGKWGSLLSVLGGR